MILIAKMLCVPIYLYALVSYLMPLLYGQQVILLANMLLAVHFIELIFAFKHVKKYSGSLTTSMLLTLLFGFLHWLPLSRRTMMIERRMGR